MSRSKIGQLRLVVITILMVLSNYFAIGQQWQTLSGLPAIRTQHASAAYNGKVYVINGSQDGFSTLSSLFIYDVQSNTWTTGTTPTGVSGRGGDAVSDENGTIYYATGDGGSANKTLYKYVISTNTWSVVPGSANKTAWNGSLSYGNGKLFYLGGESSETALNIYDISTNTWSTGASIPNPGGMMHTSAVVGNKLYMIGGTVGYTPGTQTVKVYDIPTNTWTTLPSSANFPHNVYYFNAIAYDGNIYVTGGQSSGMNDQGSQFNYYYKFIPSSSTWERLPDLPTTQGQHTLVELDAKIYSIGGRSSGAYRNYVYMNVLANGGVIAANQTFCPEVSSYDPAPFTSVSAALGGSANFSYEWEKSTDGTNWTTIAGATSLTYDVPSSDAVSSTTYFRRKAIDVSTLVVYSNVITVQKLIPLSISAQPSSNTQTICKGGSVNAISVSALGNSLTYQWYSNILNSNSGGTLITGATSNTYTPSTVNASSNYYYCVVNDGANCNPSSLTSNVSGLITVNDIPSITLGTITNIANSASSFQIPFSSILNGANQYSVTAGTTALSGFTAVNTATISGTSGNFIIPIPQNSASGTYDFLVSVKNSTTGCISQNYSRTVSIANIPTVQATNIVLSNQTSTTATISWTNGNGSGRAVFVKAANSGTASPVNNTTYTANAAFGSGTQIGTTGWYCVYRGSGTTVNVTGLTQGTNYQIMVAEYNGTYSFNNSQSTNNPLTIQNLIVSPSTLSFTACANTTSNSQTFTVTTSNPNADISVTAPSGFEISNSANGIYTSSLTIANTGTVTTTSVFVRMAAASAGSLSGNIALSSADAATVNVAVSGAVGSNNVYIGALSFDGINDKVTVADNNALDLTTNYTMEAWIYPRAFNWLGGIFSKYHSNSANGYHLRLSHVGNSRGLSFDEMVTADNILNLNTWHHVAAVNNNGNRKLYVDGVEVALTGTPTSVQANSDPLVIGKDFNFESTGRFFNGDIDEVRVWNIAKTQAQVVAQKDVSLTGSETNLVLYYNFNQGTPGGTNTSITTVSNIAAGSYTGTLSGFAGSGATSNFVESTNRPTIGGGSSLCIGSPLNLTHTVSGGTWSIPATTGLSISNTGVLTGTASTTATQVVVSYLYTYNGCQFTDTKTITIGELTVGTATGNQTLCSGSGAVTAISLAGNTSGSSIQWQSSIDNVTFNNISNATAASLNPGSVTATTYYRAAVTSTACGTLYSNVITKGYNNSLNFDGTNDHVTLPNVTNGMTSFTFESWVFPTVTSDWQRIFDFGTGETVNMFLTSSNGVTKLPRFALTTNGPTNEQQLTSTTALTQNKWNHVAVSLDAITQEGKIYINGVLSGTSTITINPSTLGALTNHYIGRSNYAADPYFKGSLDNVTIWNTVRTNDEIKSDMTTALTGTETGLVANYDFNQGIPAGANTAITSVIETKNIANNGALVNFTKTAATSNFIDGFRVLLTEQPVDPSAVCLNASSNTISVTAVGSGITYQWYSNTANNTSGAILISGATSNSYTIPTNVAGTKYYYVVVTGSCASNITSNIVSQAINTSTFTTDVSGAAQNLNIGGTATPLTVSSPGATAYQWYSSPSNPSLVSGFNGGTGWTSSTGSFQAFASYSGGSPAIHPDGYLRFAYISPSSIHRDFALDPTATTVSFSTEYASLDNNNDRGKIQLYFYGASNTQLGNVVESADLTGTSSWQPIALSNIAIPSGATKVRVVFYQIQEYPYWAGNYGIAFRNPSVTTNVALNGTAITGATSATYTPSTTTPSALYYYAVATGGCSTATSSISGLITVSKANPTIASMSAINKTFGDAAFTLTDPTSNATGAFTFTSSNTAVATISGTTVTIVSAGTTNITATQDADANYNAGSVSATLTVAKATPSFGTFAAINKTFGDAAFTLTAPTSNATGAITYSSSNTAVATVSGSTVTIIGAGSANITVTQASDANYNAGSVTAVLTVAKAARTLSVFANIDKTSTDAPFALVAPISSAGSGAITYSSSNTAVATVSGSTVTIVGVGTSTITATQAADANYLAATISATLTVKLGDSDGDGVPDDVEIREGTDPNNPSSVKDSDGDGVPDYVEIGSGTNPNNPADAIDSDGDGLSDYYEARNAAPTNISLSTSAVNENNVAGAGIINLSATDVNIGEAFTYSLVAGTGATNNASFTINGSSLQAVASFDFETKASYGFRLKVTDKGGLSFEKAFTITITDVNEAPTLTAITDRRVYNVSSSQVVNIAGISAGPETAQTTSTSVTTDKPLLFSAINVVGTQIQFTLAAGIATPQDVVVSVRVKDNGGVANGGVDSVVRTFKLGIDPLPVVAASPNLINLGATSQLSASAANAVNYTWVAVGGTGIQGSGASIYVRPRGTTTYAVVVTNSFGYQATIPVLLTVIADYKLVPNNLVTPNGDGVNDKWVIPNIDMYPDNEVIVYDKAGRAVFTKRGYNNEWDGTLNGTKLKEDSYFYVIKFNKDGALPIRGYVSIVR